MTITLSIKTASLSALEAAINHCLQFDPDALQRVRVLTGKVIGIELLGLNLKLYLLPDSIGLRLRAEFDGEVDVWLRGAPLSMMRMGLGGDQQKVLFSGDVEIVGDTETGQHIHDIMNDLDLDWEEQIATLVGDVVGHKMGNVVRGAADWATQTRSTVERDVSEYLQEESRLLPHCEEVGPFLEAVDTLRSDVDRMAARVQRLLTQRGAVE
ncbi:MAG: SCP2 sterol-binding domain-containing protein [Gammaproteobacteria bacterium]|nr:SCP2 sterol-binding domain-containing protein [Gammaproteobacteria bacterium]